ncbi:MAG: MOSC domain-containing protein [Pseudomonadota bacterium]
MQLTSVNRGTAETIEHGSKSMTTGICKRPVEGPVLLLETGVDNDAVVDAEHHGGADQAVYAYSADDYDWWAESAGREFKPGTFGENLTIRGMPSDMRVGDRLLIGEVVLEATAPRIPCATLAARVANSGFSLEFREAEKPGVYFRVLNPGSVQKGDAVTFVESDSADVTILDLFRFYYALQHDEATLLRYLEAPLASRVRARVETKLAALQSN